MSLFVTGLKWNGINQIITQGSNIVGAIILARILTPEDFGTIAMITVISSFANMFLDAGFTTALIQKKQIDQELLSTIFWIYIAISIILTIGLILAGPWISQFYNQPILNDLSKVLSSLFIISALPQIARIQFTRAMDFKSQSIGKIIGIPLSYILAIILAKSGFGLWSIVFQILFSAVIDVIFILYYSRWTPSLVFSLEKLRTISGFSFSIFSYGLLDYWSRYLDGLLIGKKYGPSEMGLYNRAFVFVLLPVRNISQIINLTVFPKYSHLQGNLEEFKSLYLLSSRFQAFLVFPSMIGLHLVADPLVRVLLGEAWIETILPIKIFSLIGILSTIQSLMDTGIFSLGYPGRLMKVGIFEKSIILLGTFIGLQFGILGVVWGRLISTVIITVSKTWLFIRVTKVSLSSIYFHLTKIAIATTCMAIAVLSVLSNTSEISNNLQLVFSIVVGALTYLFTTFLIKEPVLGKLLLHMKSDRK